ncbi:MAG: hypothetical protein ACMZ66_17980 [Thalassospira sp.]|uniref:hypothetical protein n=1 Tax=Thalassospira sp. TaxID=1912094 RepID=UPI003A897C55
MGLFDLPAPAFTTLDQLMASAIGPFGRVLIWALICAGISMVLYRLISPQSRIKQVKAEVKAAQRAMADDDGEDFGQGMQLAKAQLDKSFKLVGFVIGPAVLASLPALTMIVWMDGQYGYSCPPPGQTVQIDVEPADVAFEQIGINPDATDGTTTGACPVVQLPGTLDGQSHIVEAAAPIPVMHHKVWWNSLIGNPAGYLPDDTPVTQLRFALPSQEIISAGPDWARGWELTFFGFLLLGSLAIKKGFRIE